jgi:hypothetical protein
VTEDRRLSSPKRSRAALPCAPVVLLLCLLLPASALGGEQSPASRLCRPGTVHCSLAGRLAAAQARRARHPRRASARAHARAAKPALEGSGSVEGTVTSASPVAGLPGIEVCAYELEGLKAHEYDYGEREPDCVAVEEASGAYRIDGLAPEKYVVEFLDPQRNYVTQFWDDKLRGEESNLVEVESEATATGIDAAMVEGGRIEGVLTGGGEPLSGVFVCWAEPTVEVLGCTGTGADGHYLITGLPSGNYELGFIVPHTPGLNYLTELRGDEVDVLVEQTSFAGTAELAAGGRIQGRVTAAADGAGLAGIEVWAYGPQTIESTLTARGGGYTLERLPSDEYTVEFFDVSETYLPQFFAEKAERSEATPVAVVAGQPTTGVDAVLHTVAPEPPPPVPPVTPPTTTPTTPAPHPPGTGVLPSKVVLPSLTVGGRVHVAGRSASVKIACAAGACKGTLQLLTTVVRRHRVKGHTVKRSVTIVLGSASFSLAQGSSVTAKLRLSAAGRRLLAGAARHPRAAKLKVGLVGLAAASLRAVTVD